jgi:5'-nucleotidase
MIILVDVDSTVADLMPEWLRLYNNDYSDTLTPEKITDWDMTRFVHPDCGTRIFSYLLLDTLYDNVKPIQGALESTQELENLGHRIVFVSSGVYAYPKYQWMERNGFNVGKWGSNYIVCHDKSLIRGDILIDDGVHNIEAFKNLDAILFDQPWNRSFQWHRRAHGWNEVKLLVDRWY